MIHEKIEGIIMSKLDGGRQAYRPEEVQEAIKESIPEIQALVKNILAQALDGEST